MIELAVNQHPEKLPEITPGMFVHLKSADGKLAFKCKVLRSIGGRVWARVDYAYTYRQAGGPADNDRTSAYIGQTLEVDRTFIQHAHPAPTLKDRIETVLGAVVLIVVVVFMLRYCGPTTDEDCVQFHPRGAEICG